MKQDTVQGGDSFCSGHHVDVIRIRTSVILEPRDGNGVSGSPGNCFIDISHGDRPQEGC